MNVNVRGSELKECVLVSGIETKLNGWSWAGLVVARLSMGRVGEETGTRC